VILNERKHAQTVSYEPISGKLHTACLCKHQQRASLDNNLKSLEHRWEARLQPARAGLNPHRGESSSSFAALFFVCQ